MYSSRGGNAYGQQQPQQQKQQQQQPYTSQSQYAQNLAPGYGRSSVGGPEGSIGSRHSSMLGSHQEAEASGYTGHAYQPSSAPHYGGQYSSVYGSTAQQIPSMASKGTVSSSLEGRSGFGSALPDSPKFTSSDYVSSSSRGYSHKNDQLYADRAPDYPSVDRRQYGEMTVHVGRDMLSDQASRYADQIPYGHKNQAEVYDRLDQALQRQEQLLKAQSLQSSSLEGNSRQVDYLAGRGQAIRQSAPDHHPAQDPITYGGRIDSDPRSLSMLSSSSYGGQRTPSILGAAPQRNVEDLIYGQSSSNPGYGVSLPPGRDYGKGLHGSSLEADYSAAMLARVSQPRIDDRKDDRTAYLRELERKEKDHHRDYLREREKERERERLRERERERERERLKARERERERERILERREKEKEKEKEKDRERKHGPESRRERTPLRLSRDRRGSSLAKDAAGSVRRESPHREASHRRHTPVKEKRKEYVCKVYSFKLTEVERDYLSLDKRYPRLFISPECTKVVVHWPKADLKLSFHTPVSFEHDFIEGHDALELSAKQLAGESGKLEHGSTVWNVKMVLMSGLSRNSLEELSSDRSYDDRIPHFCNMLRFAVLKRNSSFMAIGGPWDIVDGGDPSVDDSSLDRTALRYAKDVTNLDLKNCRHWNRFLEIHYDRIGKDGLFSHKEVTVIYVPDLSDCLPALDSWRDQWFAHKKAITEREQQHALRKEKPRDIKEGLKDKEGDKHLKDVKSDQQPEMKKEASTVNKTEDTGSKMEGDLEQQVGNENDKSVENKDGDESIGARNIVKDQGENAGSQTAGTSKLGKKKIMKKIVKQKVAEKKDGVESTTAENITMVEKDTKEKTEGVIGQQDGSSAKPPAVKTFVRKKIVKKVPVRRSAKKEDEGTTPVATTGKDSEPPKDKAEDKPDSSSNTVVQEANKKTTIKRKVIKRVPKRKAPSTDAKNNGIGDGDIGKDNVKEEKLVPAEKDLVQTLGNQNSVEFGNKKNEFEIGNKVSPIAEQTKVSTEKTEMKEERRADEKGVSASKIMAETDKGKLPSKDDRATSKERDLSKEKERRAHDKKDESRARLSKDEKEKKTREEPPRHPGLLLQTKGSKDSKLQSLSLSLDSLLDYSEKDIEESTFELSLFAESLYEMLQYEMGCRLLTFLQKLRVNFVMKRNRRKRQREEMSKRESDNKSPVKRVKKDEAPEDIKSNKTEAPDEAIEDIKSSIVKEDKTSVGQIEEMKMHDDANEDEDTLEDPEEDPLEDPEEDLEEEEMPDADSSLQHDLIKKENDKVENAGDAAKAEHDFEKENGHQDPGNRSSDAAPNAETDSQKQAVESDRKTKDKKGDVDKELLQAFRFFDRNRVGYIKVEDMRLIIHNLGKFLSHRDVKELVQSALLESNTGRDDRILYDKLIRMAEI